MCEVVIDTGAKVHGFSFGCVCVVSVSSEDSVESQECVYGVLYRGGAFEWQKKAGFTFTDDAREGSESARAEGAAGAI